MKIAIHESKGDFSEAWVDYCKSNDIPFKLVDCYQNDIIKNIRDCEAFLWHHNHANPKDVLFAKELLNAVSASGIQVFPDHNTTWHFDDKLGQKYLLESLDLPLVKSYVFYTKREAEMWANNTSYPIVFKLRRGAGSRNVRLINNRTSAIRIIRKAFKKGFRQYDAYGGIIETLRKLRLKKATVKDLLKSIAHIFYPIQLEKSLGKEKGYVYFQEFIPGNTFDTRVIVIGDKAFAIKRNVRKNDFRASGSGFIEYEKENFSDEIIDLSFRAAGKLKSQCIAFDFVHSKNKPFIVEISFGFNKKGYEDCPGYWDSTLKWHEGPFNPYGWIIDNIITRANAATKQ